ncbi:MAG: group III truncated hemoglobin [Terasakiella sp.]|uniref:group III truncated hemoglobin n=1 Tax=unclassified Terasakiella TaxID=2614952 RepID=UPI003AFFACF5
MINNYQDGVSEEMISTLVHKFYDVIRDDTALGPIFNERITQWDHHLQTMCDFWSSITLKTRRFQGRPMLKHQLIADRTRPDNFARWLELFKQAVEEEIPPHLQMEFLEPAARIAQSLQIGMFQVPFDKKEVQNQLNLLEGKNEVA